MLGNRGRFVAIIILGLCGFASLLWSTTGAMVAAVEIPRQLSDEAFWKLVTDFSEPGGYFRSDNFVSNETGFQYVIPRLKKDTKPGGVYLGVGPDQNFTYIVALQPKVAFILDIRRQNMMEHLMYKALIEMSADRPDFASRLFSRKRPAGLAATASPEALFQAYAVVAPDERLYEANLKTILDRLKETHGFKLSDEDAESIRYVYKSFVTAGPDINYAFSSSSSRGGERLAPIAQAAANRITQPIIVNGQQVNGAYVPSPGGGIQTFTCPSPQEYATTDGSSRGWACFDPANSFWLFDALPPTSPPVRQPALLNPQPATVVARLPAYTDLMLSDDGHGLNRSYMATEENFQALRNMEIDNLIVPLVGDFAGDKAIRAVAKYLKDHEATVTAFYLSNVEQYLFQDPQNWKKFYANVGTLPLDSASTFIRSAFNVGNGFSNASMGSMNLLSPMLALLKAFGAGRITRYSDVLGMSQ